MKLSILTPAVPSRLEKLGALCACLAAQIGGLPVEHLVLLDNKKRTVGEKRDALLRAARGEYVAFVDDDDSVAPSYVEFLLREIAFSPDVVTFRQRATVDGETAEVEFRLGNKNEKFAPWRRVKRAAWHVCAWRRALAIQSRFPAVNYGEDWAFAEPLQALAKTSRHIAHVIHFYEHSAQTTEAPVPVN